MVNEMGLAISKYTDIDDILMSIVKVLERRLDYDRGMIFLASEDKTRLIFRVNYKSGLRPRQEITGV